ncbi:MAG: hypothetical protein IJT25_02240 [Clostridia bacterium]|nr:hypothetical protein [Clostridia bacterium]
MKETKKLKILVKAEGKYKTLTLSQLEFEAKLLEAKNKDITKKIIKLDNKIDKWEDDKFNESLNVVKESAILAGTTITLTGATMLAFGLATQSPGLTLAAGALSSIPYALVGLGNVAANIHKPVSLPIARAYARFLGDKIEILGKKKLMVDELLEAKRLEYENDIAILAEMYKIYVEHEAKNGSVVVSSTEAKDPPLAEDEEENAK